MFGKNTLDYVIGLAEGQIDYLPRLEENLIINILKFLDLEDIGRLSQVSKLFQQVDD